jgi:hypothetical protein
MILKIHELAEHEVVLAGPTDGALLLSRLIEEVSSVEDIAVVILDFRNIDVATASFLREAVLGFRDYCRNSRQNLYPVPSNLGLNVVVELEELLKLKGEAIVIGETTATGNIRSARVLGRLEEKQSLTLRAVLEIGKADAATLAKRFPDDRAKATAWHNRLTSLCSKGILMETSDGRLKVYKPVVGGLAHGH